MTPSSPAPALLSREPIVLAAEWRGLPDAPFDAAAAQAVTTCLALASALVQRHQGQLVQCTGTGLLAVFGLGTDTAQAEDIENAVACAVALQMALREWQLQPQVAQGPALYLGMGLCAGPVLAGPLAVAGSTVAVLGAVVRRAEQLRAFSLRGQILIEEGLYQRCWGLVSATAAVPVRLSPGETPLTLRELVAVPSRKLKVPRQEFRRSHRMPVALPCTCHRVAHGAVLAGGFSATVRNLGLYGLQLALPTGGLAAALPLALHDELRLGFTLPGDAEPLHDLPARVVSLPHDGCIGLEFVAPTPAFEAQVRACLQQFLALR